MEATFCAYEENLQDGETQEPEELTTEGSNTAQIFVRPKTEPILGEILLNDIRLSINEFEYILLSIVIRNARPAGAKLTGESKIIKVEFTN